MTTRTTVQAAENVFFMPAYRPPPTWGLGNKAAYAPGPGGPLRDPRRRVIGSPGPVYGRVGPLSILRAFGPGNFGITNPFPQQVVNNAYSTALLSLYVPGWYKPQPTSTSGF